MRKWLLIALLVLAVGIVGCAKEAEAKCGPKKDVCDTPLGSILNKCVKHPSPDKELMPIGVGLDLILLESDVEDITYKITLEYKYDVRNSEQQMYGVVTLKLADIIAKVKGE